jgi:3-methyl-2-oxobutanoate hydroxymethyltransferase
MPRFVRDFGREGGGVHQALQRYVAAVKERSFPEATQHTY